MRLLKALYHTFACVQALAYNSATCCAAVLKCASLSIMPNDGPQNPMPKQTPPEKLAAPSPTFAWRAEAFAPASTPLAFPGGSADWRAGDPLAGDGAIVDG